VALKGNDHHAHYVFSKILTSCAIMRQQLEVYGARAGYQRGSKEWRDEVKAILREHVEDPLLALGVGRHGPGNQSPRQG